MCERRAAAVFRVPMAQLGGAIRCAWTLRDSARVESVAVYLTGGTLWLLEADDG
jgi:hypothetical protein